MSDQKFLPVEMQDVCIWQDEVNCSDCELIGKYHCHKNTATSVKFGLPFMGITVLPLIIGVLQLPTTQMIIAFSLWIMYSLFFFIIWEPPVLCAHCPFYAEEGTKILKCSINYGFPRTAKYKPWPMNKSEKIQFLIGGFLLFGVPWAFLIYAQLWLWVVGNLVLFSISVVIINKSVCTECLNFSCPLNRVPVDRREYFLQRNPLLKENWGIFENPED